MCFIAIKLRKRKHLRVAANRRPAQGFHLNAISAYLRVKPLYFILIQSLFQRLALCVCYEIRIELSGHTNYIKTQGEYLCVVILLNQ